MTSCDCGADGSVLRALAASCAAAAWLLAAPAHGAKAYQSVGWRPTAIPIVNFSSDDGTGYGVRCSLYEYDGQTIPYVRQYSAQVFATSGGKWVHRLLVDWPEVRPGERVEVELVYEKEEFANYYGGLRDEELDAYSRQQKTFRKAFPELRALWIRRLSGPWQRRLGARLSHTAIDANADEGNLLRDLDPPGRTGGAFAQVEASLRRDTRNDYNDPTAGLLSEVLVQYGAGNTGWPGGLTASLDQHAFGPLGAGLSLALRLRGDAVIGDLPFYEELEMGGSSTVRGQAAARDRGQGRLLANGELRWRGVTLWQGQQVALGGAAFADVGQVFEAGDGPAPSAWRLGAGLGLRLHWLSTIVRADQAWAGARTGLYITFGQVF